MRQQLGKLVLRAQSGDQSALPALRQALDEDPELWMQCGDLAAHAEQFWLNLLAGKDLLLRESVERKLAALRAELSGSNPSPLERLLIGRVVACWLQVHYADAVYAQTTTPDATTAVRQEMMKRQDSAQRRYLAAIKQLALVRKLLRPTPSPLELAMRPVAEKPAVRLCRSSVPMEGEPVLN